MKRASYLWLLSLFAASRLAYFLAGVRFDASPLGRFYQLIDRQLLEHRLGESLLYLHVQPPGFNLYVGWILKLFPIAYPAAFGVIYLAAGALMACLLLHLLLRAGVRPAIALALAALFTVSPGGVLFENFLTYEYLVALALLAAAAALYRFFETGKFWPAALLFASLAALVFLRNLFHLAYFLSVFLFVICVAKKHWKTIAWAAAIPLMLVLALYLKNWILFGTFSGSTWMWAGLQAITSHNLTAAEADRLVQRGVISPVSRIDLGAQISAYRSLVAMPLKTGIPILDQEVSARGVPNFNHLAFRSIGRLYTQDALAILKNYPRAYLRAAAIAWFTYFLPPSDFVFFEGNRARIAPFDRFFNLAVYGQFQQAASRTELRTLQARGVRLGLVWYTGVFLLIGLPLLFFDAVRRLIRGLSRRELPAPRAALLAFLVFNIAYLTVISNFLSSFENNRYRFPLDSFFLILLGMSLQRVTARLTAGTKARLETRIPARKAVYPPANCGASDTGKVERSHEIPISVFRAGVLRAYRRSRGPGQFIG